MEKKIDKRILKTKSQLKFALANILKDKNIEDISIVELTSLAEINRKTFYLHYKDILEIYNEIKNELLNNLKTIINTFNFKVENIELFINIFFKTILDDKFSLIIIKNSSYGLNFIEDIINLKIYLFQKPSIQVNLTKSRFAIEFYVNGGVRLFYQWVKTSNVLDITDFSKKLTKLIVNGIH